MSYCKAGQAHTTCRLLLMPSHHCLMLFTVGHRHDDDNINNRKGCGLTHRCSEEVKCLIDMLADQHISQMLDTKVYQIRSEQIKEKGYEGAADQRRTKTDNLFFHLGTCWQAAHKHTDLFQLLGWSCSRCSGVPIESSWDHLFWVDLSSAVLFTYVQKEVSQMGNAPLFLNNVS